MKKFYFPTILLFSIFSSFAQSGSPINSFGNGGKVTTPFGSNNIINACAIQNDGKLVVAGTISDNHFILVRYNMNGTLDPTFDSDGKIETIFASAPARANAITIQADGKIVVAGQLNAGTTYDFVVVRYNENGSLDLTFDGDGIATTNVGNVSNGVNAVALQSDGKIIIAGNTFADNNDWDFALVRFNSNGSLDNSFDEDGKVITTFGTSREYVNAIAIQPDGKIIAAGSSVSIVDGNDVDYAVIASYNADGSLDNNFDNDGKITFQFGPHGSGITSIGIGNDGKLVVGGIGSIGSGPDFALARFLSNGSPDLVFGSNGQVFTSMSPSEEYVSSIALLPDGKILAGGYAIRSTLYDFVLARYNSNSSLDLTFDTDGIVFTDFGNTDIAKCMAIHSNRAYLTGFSNGNIAIAAYFTSNYHYSSDIFTITGNTLWSELDTDIISAGIQSPTSADKIYVSNNALLTIDVPNATCGEIHLGIANSGNGSLKFNNSSELSLIKGSLYGSLFLGDGNASGSLDMNQGGTMKISGNNIPNWKVGTFNPGTGITGGTIVYNGADQHIGGADIIFNNVELVNGTNIGTVLKELGISNATTLIINGNLIINSGVRAFPNQPAWNISGSGNLQGNGTVVVNRSGGTLGSFSAQYVFPNKILSNLTVEYNLSYNQTDPQLVDALNYGNLTIVGNEEINTILSPGIIGVSGKAEFTTGSYINAGNTIEFNGSDAQVIPAFHYNNLKSSNSGTRILAPIGTIGVGGIFDPGTSTYSITGSTVDFNGTSTQNIPSFNYYNLTFSNTGQKNYGFATLGIAGDFTDNSTGGGIWYGSTIKFNGFTSQSIIGTPGCQHLIIDNPAGISLVYGSLLPVFNSLTFLNGKINTGTGSVLLDDIVTISGASSNKFINGKLTRLISNTGVKEFPIGRSTNEVNDYSPFSINHTALEGSSRVTAEVINEDFEGQFPSGYTQFGRQFWRITEQGSTSRQYDITFNLTGISTTNEVKILKYNSPSTNEIYSTIKDGSNYTSTGLTSFSDFVLAEANCILPNISISSESSTICGNELMHFVSTVTNPGTDPYFVWRKNGVVMDAGGTNTSFNIVNLQEGDVITCEISNASACSTVTSNSIIVQVIQPSVFYEDLDGDGFGNSSVSIITCIAPDGYVSNSNDCDDAQFFNHPGAPEICDGLDNNCDGQRDEGVIKTTYYQDADGDGYGNPESTTEACSIVPRGFVSNNTDCNDDNALIHPDATELCNRIDDDCDGAIDEGIIKPTGTISGRQTICEGQQAEFTFNLTGTPPFDIVATDQFGSSIAVNGIAGYTFTRSWSLNNISSSRTFKLTSVTDANCSAQAQDMTGAAVVTIGDALAPDVHTKNLIVQLDAEGHASITPAQINSGSTDNCTGSADLQLTLDKTSFDCTNKGSNIVSLTVADVNGNTSNKTAIVTVVDNEKPYVKTAPQALIVSTDAGKCTASNVLLGSPEFSDNCPGTIATTDAPAVFPKGITIVTWTATDVAGNTATALQTITVVDNEKPVITSCPTVPIQCYNTNGTYTVPVLTATDNCGVQSISYAISGATSRSGNSNDASGIFNPGTSTITWSVADTSGNITNCTTTVRIDKVDVAIPDVYPTNIPPAIGNPNTIYIGYGGTSVTLSAQVTSSLTPNSFTYKWTIGSPSGTNVGTGQTITVSPTATTVYYLSIKDANTCKPLYQVTKQINVINIVCGSGKITACVPQKNGTSLTSCISSSTNTINKLPSGWYLGLCSASAIATRIVTATTKLNTDQTFNQKAIGGLEVTVGPNPSSYHFTLVIKSNSKETLSLRVADAIGRTIERKAGIAQNSTLQLGHVYRPGMYIIEVVQGNERRLLKLVKGSE
jgi:uncharacterized delta-60 repeat protein